MTFSRVLAAALMLAAATAPAAVIDTEAAIEGHYVNLLIVPSEGGTVAEFRLRATPGDYAGEGGLLQEGFGVGNPYVPNRRLNERLEADESVTDRPVLRYSYDCDGPNIRGLHVERIMEPLPDEASLLVRWKVENKGEERQWVTPWVRNDVAPGGRVTKDDRIDVPTPDGVQRVTRTGFVPAARNWIAATDPIERVTIYGVFDCDDTFAFLPLWDEEEARAGFQTAFMPRLLGPGDVWETIYRINAVRGLKHVNFASAEIAVQLDYEPGQIQLLVASVKTLKDIQIHPSVIAPNGRTWKLQPKRFTIDPNRLVRCTFDWTAPAEGTYDFLALLKQGSVASLDLNAGLNPPHGGIDTRFVVGRPGTDAGMEPWTDAPYALERGARTLKRAAADRQGVLIWAEHSLEKVFPNDRIEPTGEKPVVRVSLARNEYESFQVVVRPPEDYDLFNVYAQMGDLVNRAAGSVLAASNLKLSNVDYCPVRIPSYFEGPTGLWPDALPPFRSFKAVGGTCTPVWCTLHAPKGTPAGTYTGELTLTAIGLDPIHIPIEVTVYDFSLPDTPALQTDFGFWGERAVEMCRDAGCELPPDTIAARYVDNALAHRVTLREAAQFPAPAANYAAELRKFEPRMKDLAARGATTFSVPASLINHPEQLAQANAFVLKHGLRDHAFSQIAAEPAPPLWPTLVERMQVWRETAPDIRLMISTFGLQPFLAYGVNVWNVHTQIMDTPNNIPILKRIDEGKKEVWWFVNNYPPRPYGNFFVDQSAIEHRIVFWQAWALGIRGFHYWAVNYCEPGHDPAQGLLDVTPVNGDGFLVYPGPYGPVNSIRWETIRDGIEDYDYLALFRKRYRRLLAKGGHEALLERAAKAGDLQFLVPDLVSFPRDPQALHNRRNQIARAIVELSAVR
ncbi:MAG: DUF4091 domain-containing protein [Nitrospiraceae bacterium]|nr:DUF4091 domain-containing protein [Nitrospiraceae bacterium]